MKLFEKWIELKHQTRNNCCTDLEKYVLRQLNLTGEEIREKLLNFLKSTELRWKSCYRNKHVFISRNEAWLNTEIVFLANSTNKQVENSSKVGRPKKKFEECGKRAQQMKAQNLVSAVSASQLSFATQLSLRKFGKRDAAKIVQNVTSDSSPTPAKIYKQALQSADRSKRDTTSLSPEDALALIINTKSSKSTYLSYRDASKQCGANIYPSWHNILLAKQSCYPEQSSIISSESAAEVRLENLLHLTAKRICEMQAEVIDLYSSSKMLLLCKWGLDGSSGQSNYRQSIANSIADSSVILISFVPLQLRDFENDTKVLWQNPVPSSIRFCRVIKFIYSKETPEVIKDETEKIQKQIDDLCDFNYKGKIISFGLFLTMVDGKICNNLTDTMSTQSCYVCGAKPKEMNDLKKITEKLPRIENYSFGISTLHAWIRFFECCLHISYRIGIECWQVKGENREKMETRKKQVIENLRSKLGILVDKPKPGYGSTNTGNTARIFFQNFKESAEITGVNEELIRRFYNILQVISCGYELDAEKFKDYATQTAEKYVSNYPWYYMPPTVHKILIHGAEIISHAILPIGQLGEEAQEAKNKDFKFIREHRSRKDSAEHTNIDLLHFFLLSSDPIISSLSLSLKYKKKRLCMSTEAISLLKSPDIQYDEESNDENSEID